MNYRWVNAKLFYVLFYSIPFRAFPHSPLGITYIVLIHQLKRSSRLKCIGFKSIRWEEKRGWHRHTEGHVYTCLMLHEQKHDMQTIVCTWSTTDLIGVLSYELWLLMNDIYVPCFWNLSILFTFLTPIVLLKSLVKVVRVFNIYNSHAIKHWLLKAYFGLTSKWINISFDYRLLDHSLSSICGF